MRHSIGLVVTVLATMSTTQSTSSLIFWLPGPANNPSRASQWGTPLSTFPPVASIVSSNTATTVFALGCPLSTTTPSSVSNRMSHEVCPWAHDYGTYSIISSTKHVLHRSQDNPSASMWWTCDHDVQATKVTCDMEVSGNVNDNTDGPIEGLVWSAQPNRFGSVIAFATAEVVTAGRFGELECNEGYVGEGESTTTCDSNGSGGKGTRVWSADIAATSAITSKTGSIGTEGSVSTAAATA
ncbi:hypothetical protein OPT61_g1711 [Boeremia exigua]|uniref:Uncharacterized protein n=1 Tax=Boeremia exigua TaxID=749465 RepID=A0ACC2IPH4_9PLEO|nr:hypothetical protein OPT61_g1711 [Boeremia exigua]